jgi:glycosyltransferase involved in cell wall biosynthesis
MMSGQLAAASAGNNELLQSAHPRRVLHVMRMKGVSGAENHLLELTTRLREHGWLSDVIIPAPAPEHLKEFANRLARVCDYVEIVSMRTDVSATLVLRLARLLASGRYDVAHAHLVHADWYLAAASLINGDVPLVSSKHNPDPFRRLAAFRLVERATLRRYSAVVAISESLRRFTEASTGVQAFTVHYGLPTPTGPAPVRDSRRKTIRLLAVGRLEKQKGFDVAIDAMASVRRDAPTARLSIAGKGRERRRLSKRIAAHGLADAVSLLGNREDVDELMLDADILVHPARWEGFGLVLLEAMRVGLPIVGTQVSAIPEVVDNGVTGILISPDDPDELAAAIAELIRNPMRRREMGVAGYERLREVFSPEKMARGVAAVYDAVLAQPRTAQR